MEPELEPDEVQTFTEAEELVLVTDDWERVTCPVCNQHRPEPEGQEDEAQTFTEAEELGLVLVGTLNRLEKERDQARGWAARLEADLALAMEGLETAVTDWPETSWAVDELVKEKLTKLLAKLQDPDAGA